MKILRISIIVILFAALAAVIFQNREPVETRFLTTTFTMPRFQLLFLTASGSFTLGILVSIWIFFRPRR